ncbi:folate-binding protein [Brachybacterium endophyticum]|uniref:Folate-binding protein n=1 Tax=Brachybacterium endophyticum TaxID=2182385 RepID=A0A2U2RL54_9MICO|nr:folate-binding protein [Brachybacterium endophyticum]PWH06525.1 folate-binding protein [Brachybacterium endophyticum]
MAERRPLLEGGGAVLGEGPDHAVAAHYGAPLREQRGLLARRAVVDLGQMEVLELSGPDARSWLTTVSSQVFTDLPVGTSRSVAVLSPQGRVEHLAAATVTGEQSLLLILDPGARAGWRRYLEMMRFAARVDLTDRDDLRVLGGLAPATDILGPAGLELAEPVATWIDPHPEVASGHVAYGPDPDDATDWVLTVLDAASLESLPWHAEHLAGMLAAEALRVASHRARQITEVDERTIPHELDLLRTAVHTAKGCYRGQETVAKVMNLGQPPRRLVMLHLDGSQNVPAQAGDEVRLGGPEGKLVGRVTTPAVHVDLGPIALAVIKRATPLDAELFVGARLGGPEQGADPADADPTDEDAEEVERVWLDAAQEPVVTDRDHGERPRTARL